MEIKRDYYLNQLIASEKNNLIKVITGLRRSGKSYLLFNLFYDYLLKKGIKKSHIITIALDDLANERLRDPYTILDYIKKKIKDNDLYYIFLDEIQYLNRFEEVLNSLLHIKNVDVYVTGSNSKLLSKDVITEFRGRGDEIKVYPLTFKEFFSVYNGSVDEAWDDYFNYGGMPLVLSYTDYSKKVDYLKGLFDKVYITDIIERYRIKNKTDLDELLNILSSDIGSLTNPLKLSKIFLGEKKSKISDKTINRYIEYLEDAFLVSKVQRYDIKGKKYINSPFKYYFEDIGLRNARLNFRQVEENHVMENIIYNELKVRGYAIDIGIVNLYDYDKKGKRILKNYEVDFIASKGNNKYYIQSAFSLDNEDKLRQETNSLNNIKDSFKKIIIVKNNIKPRKDEKGITIIGLYNFLLEENSLDL